MSPFMRLYYTLQQVKNVYSNVLYCSYVEVYGVKQIFKLAPAEAEMGQDHTSLSIHVFWEA